MRQLFIFIACISFCTGLIKCSTDTLSVRSPDGTIIVRISGAENDDTGGQLDQLAYTVQFDGEMIMGPSGIGLEFRNFPDFMRGLRIAGSERSSLDDSWEHVWGKRKTVRNRCNILTLHLADEAKGLIMDVIFRVYNEGVALRYHIPEQENIGEFELTADRTSFAFLDNHTLWAAQYGSFKSHQESEFNEMAMNDPQCEELCGLPILIKIKENAWAAITEANLTDWAGMYLRGSGDNDLTFETVLSPYPENPELLVRSKAPRYSPWRVIMIGNSPGDLVESDLIANLNDPCALEDVSWIRPGKSAWDWWWCNSYGPDVDFELGSNTRTMKHFIDLAGEMGWEYQLVDWYWYGPPFVTEGGSWIPHPESLITTMNPDIDIPELVQYAAERDVKILIWLQWAHADSLMEEAFPLYEKWGVAGVKVDFMQRDDQYMVNFYHRLVKLAARHNLVVDFHGAYKPTGVSRTYPNLMTREGVMGNEYAKWSRRITPDHKVTIPFTRGLLGEMDFTPGAFVNVSVDSFRVEAEAPSPMTMGTRCNELAMMVVYESPLQVLCDAPHNYRSSPAGTDFLKIVPTTWDDTRVLNAEVGNYISVARRSGREWYIGSMTDGDARTLKIPLGFLDEGSYEATLWMDAPDADLHPTHLETQVISVDKNTVLEASLAVAGGHVVRVVPGK